ncbi:double zinc ribbon domain-containing protein [Halobellus salinisoli]|uniref:double zinc ribbon domain-containing protein n=1 Tax=Halobellus salinisoli TaxID=3108500 RepID=UPI003009EEA0
MSKITFRADDDLVERLEALDTSKSEAMRDALRIYLDGADRDIDRQSRTDEGSHDAERGAPADEESGSVDEFIRERVDELVADRLDDLIAGHLPPERPARDFNVNVQLDGVRAAHSVPAEVSAREASTNEASATEAAGRSTGPEERKTQTDEVSQDAGSKPCEKCGENVSADHVYCPNCGEKASHRVFCECGDELRSDWAFCPGCGRRTSAADVLERS